MMNAKEMLQKLFTPFGYRVQRIYDPTLEKEFIALHKEVSAFTMTSLESQYALYTAVKHIAEHRIEGDIVECGVWKGGSAMIIARTLLAHNDTHRTLYLYDTYAGMSEPTEKDVNLHGTVALKRWRSLRKRDENAWAYASLPEVERNMAATGYPKEKLVFVKGKVEETIPGTLPSSIALLRLDTDWYESTRHELEHLFPRLVKGGVLILDDYGHWRGAREAVDEYFVKQGIPLLLNRIDYGARIGIKI